MFSWILEFSVVAVGILLMMGVLFSFMFSTPSRRKPMPPRFDRRDFERIDRRRSDAGPPNGEERRRGPRRLGELAYG